jgi:hypothetical protein
MTPYLWRGIVSYGGGRYIGNQNAAGYYFTDMMDAIIKTGLKYKIPILDNFYHGGVTMENAWQYIGDSCHLNYYGGISIAKNIRDFLLLNPIVIDPKWLQPGGKIKFVSDSPDPDPDVHVTGVSLDITSITGPVGTATQLTATIVPANATNKTVVWLSSDDSVATVSNTGLVIITGTGTALITCLTDDGGFNATCDVIAS